MLSRHVFKPVWDFKGKRILRCYPLRGKPVGAFPSVFGTINRAFFFQLEIERTASNTARRIMLFIGPVDCVMFTINFCGSFNVVSAAFVIRTETPNIQRPDIKEIIRADLERLNNIADILERSFKNI